MFSTLCNSPSKLWKSGKNLQRVSKIEVFINKYDGKGKNNPSRPINWKKIEKNNPTITLNILFFKKDNKKEISKNNSARDKQLIFLMVSEGEKMVLSCGKITICTLFSGKVLTNNCDFYCLNCLHSFGTKIKVKSHERICKSHDFCDIMSEQNKILKYIYFQKSIKIPFLFV